MADAPEAGGSRVVVVGGRELAELNPIEAGKVSPHRLYEDDLVRIRSVAIDTGEQLRAHTAPVPILVAVAEGSVRFEIAGRPHELTTGGMVRVEADVEHAVSAHEPSRIVVVMITGARSD